MGRVLDLVSHPKNVRYYHYYYYYYFPGLFFAFYPGCQSHKRFGINRHPLLQVHAWVRPFSPLRHCMSTCTHRHAPSALRQMLPVSESHAPNFLLLALVLSSVFGPSAWNKLPLSLRQTPTLTTFKSNLKTHLFSNPSSVLFCFRLPASVL